MPMPTHRRSSGGIGVPSSWRPRREPSRCCFFFQAEDGIRDVAVTGVQTCALPILRRVELDPELAQREAERVARRTVHLRQAAERQRVLQVARGAPVPEVAAREQLRSEERRVGKECASQRAHHRDNGERYSVWTRNE